MNWNETRREYREPKRHRTHHFQLYCHVADRSDHPGAIRVDGPGVTASVARNAARAVAPLSTNVAFRELSRRSGQQCIAVSTLPVEHHHSRCLCRHRPVALLLSGWLRFCAPAVSRAEHALFPVPGNHDDTGAGDHDPRLSGSASLRMAGYLRRTDCSPTLQRIRYLSLASVLPDLARRTGRCSAPGRLFGVRYLSP